ncbi:hypothetical protein Plhal703r1_c26g0109111 [Plasmopara halstedii]
MMDHFVEKLSPPPPNAEKMADLYNKIRPYVPEEYQEDRFTRLQVDSKGTMQRLRNKLVESTVRPWLLLQRRTSINEGETQAPHRRNESETTLRRPLFSADAVTVSYHTQYFNLILTSVGNQNDAYSIDVSLI